MRINKILNAVKNIDQVYEVRDNMVNSVTETSNSALNKIKETVELA